MNSEDWKMVCLARYVIRISDIQVRRRFLYRYQKRNGKPATAKLKDYIMQQWQTKNEWMVSNN